MGELAQDEHQRAVAGPSLGIAERAKISAISASGAAKARLRAGVRIARNLASAAQDVRWRPLHSPPVLSITTKSPVRGPRAHRARPLAATASRSRSASSPGGATSRSSSSSSSSPTLRRAGILRSQRGVKGGYPFARRPAEVTVLEVVELLDGELGSGPGATDQVWTEATGALKSALRATSIADLAEREADVGSPMYYI